MNKRFFTLALSAALAGLTLPVAAQTYPAKPIKIVVPFPAGGTSDVLARMIGQKMTESWGQPVVIENKPGSSGNLGADAVAKSAADGHTLVLMDVGNLVISPALFKLPSSLFSSLKRRISSSNTVPMPWLSSAGSLIRPSVSLTGSGERLTSGSRKSLIR